MVKFACADYGFECKFEVEGQEGEAVGQFMHHSLEEHGIEYSYGGLRQFLLRKTESALPYAGIQLGREDVKTIISVLEYASTFLPLSTISDGKVDSTAVRGLVEKLSGVVLKAPAS